MRREVWSILLPLLGVNLWALLCLMPLQLEWLAEDTRWLVVLAYLLPLGFLTSGMLLRWVGLLLCLFPASFVPIYLVLPEADRVVHETMVGWFSLAASIGMYICVGAVWSRSSEPGRLSLGGLGGHGGERPRRSGRELLAEPVDRPALRHHLWWPYRLHFTPRWVFLALLLIVPLFGLNFAEGVRESYTTGFGSQADHAQVMANLIFMFTWVVIAYLYFFSPGLNLELEQRELDVSMKRIEDRAAGHPAVWLFVLATISALALMGMLMAWKLR